MSTVRNMACASEPHFAPLFGSVVTNPSFRCYDGCHAVLMIAIRNLGIEDEL